FPPALPAVFRPGDMIPPGGTAGRHDDEGDGKPTVGCSHSPSSVPSAAPAAESYLISSTTSVTPPRGTVTRKGVLSCVVYCIGTLSFILDVNAMVISWGVGTFIPGGYSILETVTMYSPGTRPNFWGFLRRKLPSSSLRSPAS